MNTAQYWSAACELAEGWRKADAAGDTRAMGDIANACEESGILGALVFGELREEERATFVLTMIEVVRACNGWAGEEE